MTQQYQSPAAAARRWKVSRQRVMQWLDEERIPGARTATDPLGKTVWLIPKTAKRPESMLPHGRKPKDK